MKKQIKNDSQDITRKDALKKREQVPFALEIIDNISQNFTLEGMSQNALRTMLLSCITNDTVEELEKNLKRAKRLGKVKAEKFIAINEKGKALHAKSSYILFSKDNRDKVITKTGLAWQSPHHTKLFGSI